MAVEPSFLETFDLFAAVGPEQRALVAERLVEQSLPKGSKIFGEGEDGDRMYLVAAGVVRVSKVVNDGEEALAMLRPGASFGEMSLIDDQPRSADAWANEDVVLYTLSASDLQGLLQADNALAIGVLTAMIRTLTLRLRETNEQVKAMHLMSMW